MCVWIALQGVRMDNFLQEIEQDIRQEKIWQFWKKYQTHLTWGAAVVLILTAMWNMWTWHTHRQNTQWAESFMRAQLLLDQGKADEALRYLTALEHTGSSYAILSSFVKAHFYGQSGDHNNAANAVKAYECIAQYKHVSHELRELAQLCSIMAQMDMPKPDLESLLKKVDQLMSEKAYWPLLAQEVKGALLLMTERHAEAREVFVRIAQNADAPPSMRSRAQVLSRTHLDQHDTPGA